MFYSCIVLHNGIGVKGFSEDCPVRFPADHTALFSADHTALFPADHPVHSFRPEQVPEYPRAAGIEKAGIRRSPAVIL